MAERKSTRQSRPPPKEGAATESQLDEDLGPVDETADQIGNESEFIPHPQVHGKSAQSSAGSQIDKPAEAATGAPRGGGKGRGRGRGIVRGKGKGKGKGRGRGRGKRSESEDSHDGGERQSGSSQSGSLVREVPVQEPCEATEPQQMRESGDSRDSRDGGKRQSGSSRSGSLVREVPVQEPCEATEPQQMRESEDSRDSRDGGERQSNHNLSELGYGLIGDLQTSTPKARQRTKDVSVQTTFTFPPHTKVHMDSAPDFSSELINDPVKNIDMGFLDHINSPTGTNQDLLEQRNQEREEFERRDATPPSTKVSQRLVRGGTGAGPYAHKAYGTGTSPGYHPKTSRKDSHDFRTYQGSKDLKTISEVVNIDRSARGIKVNVKFEEDPNLDYSVEFNTLPYYNNAYEATWRYYESLHRRDEKKFKSLTTGKMKPFYNYVISQHKEFERKKLVAP